MPGSTEKVNASATVSNMNLSNTNSDGTLTPPLRKATHTINPLDYYYGPRDMEHHSKWPIFMRMHGSIIPEMILPLIVVSLWSTLITLISKKIHNLGVDSILLTVLGFVVGLSLSFRTSTAYERYNEGRKYWAQLTLVSQNLSRLIWVHTEERHDTDAETGKKDLLGKISALNLIDAFAVALKHKLRYQPYANYEGLKEKVNHLDTYAKHAGEHPAPTPPGLFKTAGLVLGLDMAESNPRKAIKRARQPLGNLPLEILAHLSAYLKTVYDNSTLKVSIYQTQSLNALSTMNDVLVGTERILNTPMPIAYVISISQITWVYILLLPFQLYNKLEYITIPACVFAAYIILGLALIGREIENPFGDDVNDLPLGAFCTAIRRDIDIIMSRPAPQPSEFISHQDNMLFYPLDNMGSNAWGGKSVEQIRDALAAKATVGFPEAAPRKTMKKVNNDPPTQESVEMGISRSHTHAPE